MAGMYISALMKTGQNTREQSNITGIQILIPMGKEKYVLYSEIAGAIVNLIVNAVLIPRLGASGAAIGTVSAEFIVLIYQMCVLRKDLGKLFKGIQIWKIITAIGLAVLASLAVRRSSLPVFLSLLAGGIFFFAVYGIVLLILRESVVWEYWNTGKSYINKFLKNRH